MLKNFQIKSQKKYNYFVGVKGSKLILGEATSALNNKSEKSVQKALDNISNKNVTTVIIAHRLSIIQNVDVIKRKESVNKRDGNSSVFSIKSSNLEEESDNGDEIKKEKPKKKKLISVQRGRIFSLYRNRKMQNKKTWFISCLLVFSYRNMFSRIYNAKNKKFSNQQKSFSLFYEKISYK